ncbi:ATPase related to the helicase subunit of the Holliday junction resolvase [Labilithrix luteola]|uniref:ATPase related to the helicase subunit of the Holliday junction resolvase n=1 Tax=Labilithrix luteola TaxID=1391654 RepID=A0A0K1PJ04_9BACT|nr:LuxR family transcriptional regulator [Labilithrix luteola]AKU93502.1 ATPase related to the helicase subunit of the Holliday junction resolvase [Labilithrix luteola]
MQRKERAEGASRRTSPSDSSEPPSETLGSRIQDVLRHLFVGRDRDLATFLSAYQQESTGVVLVSGELGIGKSALLERFSELARRVGAYCARVDWRTSNPRVALAKAVAKLRAHARDAQRPVLVIDHFHRLARDKAWFFETCLPSLPKRALAVIASRRELTKLRMGALGLVAPFCKRIELGELDDEAVSDYLRRREVPEASHAGIVSFSRGIPMLLALAAEVTLESRMPWSERHERMVLGKVAHPFMDVADSDERRTALTTLCVARSVVFESLAATLPRGANVSAMYKWLAARPFVQPTASGLKPHALTRAACLALLRHDHPSSYQSVVTQLREFYDAQLRNPSLAHSRWVADRIHLERHRLSFRHPIYEDESEHEIEPARPEDHEAIVALTATHEGASTARWVKRWLDASVGTCDVLRAPTGRINGYALTLEANGGWPSAVSGDPALATITSFLKSRKDANPEGGAYMLRSSIAVHADKGVRYVSTLLSEHLYARVRQLPMPRFHFGVTSAPEIWFDAGVTLGFEPAIAGRYVDDSVEHVVFAFEALDAHREEPPNGGAAEPSAPALESVPAPSDGSVPPKEAPPPAEGASPNLAPELGELLRARFAKLAADAGLTDREKQVLDLVVLGRNSVEIGKVLGIAARTAKFHQARLLSKLGADSRVDILRLLL